MKLPNQDLKWMLLGLLSDEKPRKTESIIAEYPPADGKQIVALLANLWNAEFIGKISEGPERWFITRSGLKAFHDQALRDA